jgi:2-polyprenyl-3-methyl-5-hydroxy-6-metoxy-1,4-benzoquinol methylase
LDERPEVTSLTSGGEHTTCYVCGSADLEHKFVVKGFTIVRCRQCSLQFVKARVSQDELDRFYEEEKDPEDEFVYDDPANVRNLNFYYYKIRDVIERHAGTRGRILDVGCSAGCFLDVMEGWERHGIELTAAYSQKARAKYGDNIHRGTLDDYVCDEAYFDVITLQDVFDHVRDPLGTLRACHRLLAPGGLIIIKVHNISCLYSKVTGPRFYALLPPEHLSYFNKTSLRHALSRTGFVVLYHTYIGHLLSLKTVAYRLSHNRRPSLFYSLYKVLRRSPVGDVSIRKNLHDIITIVATKGAD